MTTKISLVVIGFGGWLGFGYLGGWQLFIAIGLWLVSVLIGCMIGDKIESRPAPTPAPSSRTYASQQTQQNYKYNPNG